MNIPAWHIVGWPTIDVSVDRWTDLSNFRLAGHSSRLDDDGRRVGNTVWTADIDGGQIGLAWEWCELQSSVFVMTDPMCVMSNVVLKEGTEEASGSQRVLHLNNAVYQLPWQKRLASALRGRSQEDPGLPLAA